MTHVLFRLVAKMEPVIPMRNVKLREDPTWDLAPPDSECAVHSRWDVVKRHLKIAPMSKPQVWIPEHVAAQFAHVLTIFVK